MIDAAKVADREGAPLSRLLTIRTSGMRLSGDGGILREHHSAAGCVVDFINRHTRWCTYRGIPVTTIWVREFCSHHQEHLHLGYHMPAQHDGYYAKQLSLWLDEDMGPHNGEPATIMTSELRSWQIDGCIKEETSGHHIAAYLGKSKPNKYRTAWGKERRNAMKPRRSQTGGEGPIEGTAKHYYRWGASYVVGRTQRDRNGYQW